VKELIEAAKKMNQILHQCEEEGDNMDVVLNKLSGVKVHGVVFPTLMLLEIMSKFAEGAIDRHKAKFSGNDQEEQLQKKYSDVVGKWNNKLN